MISGEKLVRYCFFILFFFTPLFFLPNTSELFEFNKMIVVYVLTLLVASSWIIHSISNGKLIFRHTSLDWPIVFFLTTQFISFLFSIDQRTSLMGYYSRFNGGLLSLLCYSLLYWAFVTFMDRKSAQNSISISLWTVSLVSVYGILEHYGIDATLWVQDVQNRVFSTLGQPNWLAAYIVILIFMSISNLMTKNGWAQLILPAVMFLTLLFTKSRSGIMAFGMSSMYFTWQIISRPFPQLRHSNRKLLIFAFISLIFVLTFTNPIRDLVITSQPLLTPGKSTGPALEEGGTESGAIRKVVWTGAMRIWRSSPKTQIIGTGPETFTMGYYQNRPIEHNNTSEWDLLYNKAHNEFLNYLATTGLLGLFSYLFLLYSIARQMYSSYQQLRLLNKSTLLPLQSLALFCGWITIPITNFWGFSVVIIQVYMFVLPAFSLSLQTETPAASASPSQPLNLRRIALILVVLGATSWGLFSLFQYWLADLKYASGQYNLKAFRATADTAYILQAYENLTQAFELNSADPVISSELSLTTAYLSVLTSETDATASAQLAETSMQLASKAIFQSPHHPNFYKSASRTAMLLGSVSPNKLDIAVSSLLTAKIYSPTDPLIPYNLGIVYKMQQKYTLAQQEFQAALQLKPDHSDSLKQLDEIASASAQKITP